MPFHIQEAIQHRALRICLLAYTSLFSIKSNVLKLGTAQKVYSVNKGLFLDVFSSPWFTCIHGQVPRDVIYRALVNYAEIFYDLYWLAAKTDATVHSYYYSWHALLVIDFLIPNGMLWFYTNCVMAPECL